MVPQIENSEEFDNISINNINEMPSKTYKLIINDEEQEDRISGFVDDIEAIKQTIYHILSIERYTYDIYDDDYGVELEQYIGQDFSYIEATIKDTLEEALMQDDRILGINTINLEKLSDDSIYINFIVDTNTGKEIKMEVQLNV